MIGSEKPGSCYIHKCIVRGNKKRVNVPFRLAVRKTELQVIDGCIPYEYDLSGETNWMNLL